jgi:hypothetical protein
LRKRVVNNLPRQLLHSDQPNRSTMFTSLFLSVVSASRIAAHAESSGAVVVNLVVEDGAPPGAGVVRWRR